MREILFVPRVSAQRQGQTQRVLVSSIGDGTVQLVEVTAEGKMKVVGQATVGKAPKRVAFIPSSSTISDQ